jgi:N-acetylneuraminate synthase
MNIAGREIGINHPPFVIAEIGINHEGDMEKARRMVRDAAAAGAECVKFQCRMPSDELNERAKDIRPPNANESAWDLFTRCALTEEQDRELKALTESLGMIYLSTPYCFAAVDRLERLGVPAYKIGSGENRNYPFLVYVSARKKPIILSSGMTDRSERVRAEHAARFCHEIAGDVLVLECTSTYPTEYKDIRLGIFRSQIENSGFITDYLAGLSDHSIGIWTALGAVALGASIIEKHFTSDKSWSGPDIACSIDPGELNNLIVGSRAIWEARGGTKDVLPGEVETRRWYEATRK